MVNSDLDSSFIEKFKILPYAQTGELNKYTFAVKDTIDVFGRKTSCGNPTWLNTHNKAVVNAVCVEQLLSAGACCLGKTYTGELSCGVTGVNKFFGTPKNPNSPLCLPGGSSSGSASVVASNAVDFSLGTDAGGSVRVPASYCSIYGMRPSHGIISLAGVFSLSPSFDTVGVFTNRAAVLLKVMKVLLPINSQNNLNREKIGNIFILKDLFDSLDENVKVKFNRCIYSLNEIYGGKVVEITSDLIDGEANDPVKGWANTFKTIFCSETWSVLGSWIEQVNLEFGKTTHVDFSRVRGIDRKSLYLALCQREIQFSKLNNFLHPNNLLCIPSTPNIAPMRTGYIKTEYEQFRKLLSISALGNLPQISMPLWSNNEITPIGISLIGANRSDNNLLSVVNNISCYTGQA